jgi:hypothetical protein
MAFGDVTRRAIVPHEARVGHGQIRGALLEGRHGIAARSHDVHDRRIGVIRTA